MTRSQPPASSLSSPDNSPGAGLASGHVRPRVSVVGSGTRSYPERAGPLGEALARLGVHLVTGGGGGTMEEVARGFTAIGSGRGVSIGILPAGSVGTDELPPGYPNPWVEIPIHTHLSARGERGRDPDSRNHLVVLSGQVVVALPGGPGTRSEVGLAVAYERPVVAYLDRRSELPGVPREVPVLSSLDEVLDFVRHELENRSGGRIRAEAP